MNRKPKSKPTASQMSTRFDSQHITKTGLRFLHSATAGLHRGTTKLNLLLLLAHPADAGVHLWLLLHLLS